jgi:hypothetical protein
LSFRLISPFCFFFIIISIFPFTTNDLVLRLLPPVPANGRFAIRDTVLPLGGGPDGKSPVFVAKGNRVGYVVHTMHRRPDFFGPDPDAFRPERWENAKRGWEYLPFNGGPRICLGRMYPNSDAPQNGFGANLIPQNNTP